MATPAGNGRPARYIGVMSGTSLDGVDGALVETQPPGSPTPLRVLEHAHQPFPDGLRRELMALNEAGGHDELSRAALAGNALVRLYADVVNELVASSGTHASNVRAIGAHGQTVRHQPGAIDAVGYTLQINSPALLAELTGIDVVADFRSRDLAAGGQGAPLASGFHRAMFARAEEVVGVLNLGGISNLTVLDGDAVIGFDCGPGNGLMDYWCERHTGQTYDDAGRWAGTGHAIAPLLQALLAEPYLALPPPKSTGRDLFNPEWLARHVDRHAASGRSIDVQATLAEFTACCIAQDVRRHAANIQRLIVCGGGAYNAYLLGRIAALVPPAVQVVTSDALGLPPLQVEAAAFAWLAQRCIERLPGNLPTVTGARGERVLGAVYPA